MKRNEYVERGVGPTQLKPDRIEVSQPDRLESTDIKKCNNCRGNIAIEIDYQNADAENTVD